MYDEMTRGLVINDAEVNTERKIATLGIITEQAINDVLMINNVSMIISIVSKYANDIDDNDLFEMLTSAVSPNEDNTYSQQDKLIILGRIYAYILYTLEDICDYSALPGLKLDKASNDRSIAHQQVAAVAAVHLITEFEVNDFYDIFGLVDREELGEFLIALRFLSEKDLIDPVYGTFSVKGEYQVAMIKAVFQRTIAESDIKFSL
jgi:hypothetical protein